MGRPTTRPVKAIREDSFGWRLGLALERSSYGGKVNPLAKELRGRGTNGQAIGEYLRNEKEPRRDVLEALAKALEVRVSWLAFGDGPMLDDKYSVRSTPLYLIGAPKEEEAEPADTKESFLRGLGKDAKGDYVDLAPFEKVAIGYLLARAIKREKRRQVTAFDRGALSRKLLVDTAAQTSQLAGGKFPDPERAKARRGSRIWRTHFVQAIATLMLGNEGEDVAQAMKKA